jgi:hypothetical protein
MPEPGAAIQGTLDFETGGVDGIEHWRRERERRLKAIADEWSLPLGRPVRLRLRNVDCEFEGTLRLSTPPVAMNHRMPLQLALGQMVFASTEIEHCSVLG